MIRELQ